MRAAACLKPECGTSAAFLKLRIQGALQHYLRDNGRLVRVSRREHEKGIHPWGHQSLAAPGLRVDEVFTPGVAIAHGADERPFLDNPASPGREEPETEVLDGSAEALLERLPANEAAILRLRVLEGQWLRSVARELGMGATSGCEWAPITRGGDPPLPSLGWRRRSSTHFRPR